MSNSHISGITLKRFYTLPSLCKAQGISLKGLSLKVGLSQGYLNYLLRNKRPVTLKVYNLVGNYWGWPQAENITSSTHKIDSQHYIRTPLTPQIVANIANIKRLRMAKGLSLAELSRILGIHYANLKLYETGYNTPSFLSYNKLAKFFGWRQLKLKVVAL